MFWNSDERCLSESQTGVSSRMILFGDAAPSCRDCAGRSSPAGVCFSRRICRKRFAVGSAHHGKGTMEYGDNARDGFENARLDPSGASVFR